MLAANSAVRKVLVAWLKRGLSLINKVEALFCGLVHCNLGSAVRAPDFFSGRIDCWIIRRCAEDIAPIVTVQVYGDGRVRNRRAVSEASHLHRWMLDVPNDLPAADGLVQFIQLSWDAIQALDLNPG